MPDIFTKSKRSDVMARIRSRGNQATEVALMRVFRAQGITGWRRQLALRATVEGSEMRVEIRRTSPKALTPSLSPIGWARVAADFPRSGGGGAPTRRKTSPDSTSNSQPRAFRVRPDFIFPKLRLAVFVDGCFWHGCPQHGTKPRQNAAFWRKKFAANQARDRLVTRRLRQNGWQVLRLWEHELARTNETRLVRRIQRALTAR